MGTSDVDVVCDCSAQFCAVKTAVSVSRTSTMYLLSRLRRRVVRWQSMSIQVELYLNSLLSVLLLQSAWMVFLCCRTLGIPGMSSYSILCCCFVKFLARHMLYIAHSRGILQYGFLFTYLPHVSVYTLWQPKIIGSLCIAIYWPLSIEC